MIALHRAIGLNVALSKQNMQMRLVRHWFFLLLRVMLIRRRNQTFSYWSSMYNWTMDERITWRWLPILYEEFLVYIFIRYVQWRRSGFNSRYSTNDNHLRLVKINECSYIFVGFEDCSKNPCQDGTICLDTKEGFTCICAPWQEDCTPCNANDWIILIFKIDINWFDFYFFYHSSLSGWLQL